MTRFGQHARATEHGGAVRQLDDAIAARREGMRGALEAALAPLADNSADSSDRLRSLGRALWSVCGDSEACWRDGCADCATVHAALRDVGAAFGDVAALCDRAVRLAFLARQGRR